MAAKSEWATLRRNRAVEAVTAGAAAAVAAVTATAGEAPAAATGTARGAAMAAAVAAAAGTISRTETATRVGTGVRAVAVTSEVATGTMNEGRESTVCAGFPSTCRPARLLESQKAAVNEFDLPVMLKC